MPHVVPGRLQNFLSQHSIDLIVFNKHDPQYLVAAKAGCCLSQAADMRLLAVSEDQAAVLVWHIERALPDNQCCRS
jgi:hypothetical protein